MYRLTVVSGPNRGDVYSLEEGENFIGRQDGNKVVLRSGSVSKRHCVLVCSNGELVVRDAGSSNGTFVNGVLSAEKRVAPGDRISVGEFVLELGKPNSRRSKVAHSHFPSNESNVIAFPSMPSDNVNSLPEIPNLSDSASLNETPTDLKGRLIWRFQNTIMPYFYSLNMKHEWRMMLFGFLGVFVLLNVVLTVEPLLTNNAESLNRETRRRAGAIARRIVSENSQWVSQKMYTKTDLGSSPDEAGVQAAVLLDMENRIIAPASRMNQYFTVGEEAKVATTAKKHYRKKPSGRGFSLLAAENLVVAIEPIQVFNPKTSQNETVAIALVSIDTTLSGKEAGSMGMVYAEVLITTSVLAILFGIVFYQLTLKPFQVLNDDIDRVLKGDLPQVTHEFKLQELDSLWDVINSALQRLPKDGSDGSGGLNSESKGMELNDLLPVFRGLGESANVGMVVCDSHRQILSMSESFQDVTGLREYEVQGQELNQAGRDQAFNAVMSDLFEKSLPGGEIVHEECEFSGVMHRIGMIALGGAMGAAQGYLVTLTRAEDIG